MTDRSRFAEYRDRQRGGPPRALKPHGTVAAARRHQRSGGTAELRACKPCSTAWDEHQAEMYQKRVRKGVDKRGRKGV